MKYSLKDGCYLKRLEEPYIYDTSADELYLLDEESFSRVLALCGGADDPEAAGLLEEAGLAQRHPRRDPVTRKGRSATPSLRYLEMQITGRCNKACRHCYQGDPSNRDMKVDQFRSLLEEFSQLQGLKIMVSGGEPACHPDFKEIAGLLPLFPLRSVLITHGEWVDGDAAGWLGRSFHQVQVSLDGMEAGHDSLRGEGSFPRALAGIKALADAGVPVSVGTMVHRKNLDQFDQMSVLLKDLGVQEWAVDVPCPAGRWDLSPDPELLRAMSEKLRYAFGGGFHGGSDGLACGSHLMTVAPGGEAARCGFYFDDPAGNIREGLGKVWKRTRHVPLENLACDCDQVEECAGGCRFRAAVLEGSDVSPDVVQCYARGKK